MSTTTSTTTSPAPHETALQEIMDVFEKAAPVITDAVGIFAPTVGAKVTAGLTLAESLFADLAATFSAAKAAS